MDNKKSAIDIFIDKSFKESIPSELPVIPTRAKLIVFPNSVIPMIIGRKKSVKALEKSLEEYNNLLFFVSQKEIELEDVNVEDLFKIGTVGRVVQIAKLPDGEYKILVEGLKRAEIKKVLEDEEMFRFEIKPLERKYKTTKTLEALVRKVKTLFEKYINLSKKFPQEAVMVFKDAMDPEIISDLIASVLPLELEEKQELLEELHPKKRLELELELLMREIELLEIEEVLESKVREKIEKGQKEYYLREKLKAIQEELSGETDEEIKEIREKIESSKLPDYVKEKAEYELSRLEKMSPYSPEANVVRTYLDWIINLPWNEKTIDRIDIKEAEKLLNKNHYGLKEPKERILEFLAVRKLSDKPKSPILCFVGAPGVGKTSLGKSVAEALGRKFGRISLGGMRDEAEIRGHRRTYVGAMPGRIIQLIKRLGVKNPVIVLDEIDKLGISYQGDPSAALLEVLDPEQNNNFIDHYLEIPFDLSEVVFITTANVLHTIPTALRDRMEIIHISGYTDAEKYYIAKDYIIPKLLEEHGLNKSQVKISKNALQKVISEYTREAGVRSLERILAKLMRKIALKIAEGEKTISIKLSETKELLGTPPYFKSNKLEKPEIGVATGMAWTAYGGEILQVETLITSGKGKVIITGKLGDVMKESAQIAVTLSKSLIEEIDKSLIKKFETCNFHIHVPEGAVPKDGPSAGVTLTIAIISSILKKHINNEIAMTGEITLMGKVLPVGGIKEKLLSAFRSGIKEVIIPKNNEKDLEKIPEEILKRIKVHKVSNIKEVLKIALMEE
ncbi:ATP-dependent Lon protease [Marinitoga hydrogenitolerans DSM 16785]|uniref:Lon protease n=1 Tax=Marinitoga hydrogenitolerans (strain DSM 16785 / JCM 12826 / AT1271) TaxID=1122195 RepID=A0A1M4S4K4_MARH1|nr:endopeptidase La [Marinitoga hydrogenitolerans]SHE27131.1 ATP-dependent Lon protease [Marinitoga hydrogenitolerans DSM 16785]